MQRTSSGLQRGSTGGRRSGYGLTCSFHTGLRASLRIVEKVLVVGILLAGREAAAAVPATKEKGPTAEAVRGAMKRAGEAFRSKAAAHGGYVYYYLPDFSRRWGEGEATSDQIFVQRPGTPAVGMAYLKAYAATQDGFYRDAARDAGEALVKGQLASGGWTQTVDFDPMGKKLARYRRLGAKGNKLPNNSTLDDGITSHALRFLIHLEQTQHPTRRKPELLEAPLDALSDATRYALETLLAAQHPGGAFPQVWTGPSFAAADAVFPQASFPDYDWRTENRIKEYWTMPTLNDDLCGQVAEMLEDAWTIRKDENCRQALIRLGDFLLRAQLPDPQPAWAQQYDLKLRPIWARKFEPPAVAGRESQDAIRVLIRVYRLTGDDKYLEPIPKALKYLERSRLPDGRLARYYELRTNKPLYMTRDYQLTHDDSDLPQHYGWKTASQVDDLRAELARAKWDALPGPAKPPGPPPASPQPAPREDVAKILSELDAQGLWVSAYAPGTMLVGQPKFKPGQKFVSSAVFCERMETLAEWLLSQSSQGSQPASR